MKWIKTILSKLLKALSRRGKYSKSKYHPPQPHTSTEPSQPPDPPPEPKPRLKMPGERLMGSRPHQPGMENAFGQFLSRHDWRCLQIMGCDLHTLKNMREGRHTPRLS